MSELLLNRIRSGVIGDGRLIPTSFGDKPLVYADYTASGRSLDFIENYIQQQVLPYYANTHTETSYTGAQTTALREQARGIIAAAVNAGPEDSVIFCGPGATAAINKLIDVLNIRLPADLLQRHQLLAQIPAAERPVVFIGPYEHHSNELPWRESIADVEVIPLDQSGRVDRDELERRLILHSERAVKIGSFSAASNVTGIKSDVDDLCVLLHAHGACALWDYAAAAPYLKIDMNPSTSTDDCDLTRDAVFISPHKFVGGPGSPGVLVIKNRLLNNTVPAVPGGGTVLYVTPEDHRYIAHHERREEGGTPAIVESIRAGLVFKLQQQVGTDLIEERESRMITRAVDRWSQCPTISILGSLDAERLSIVSLRIQYGDKDLHYAFVVALLNDLFGIQARGGCSCAGPYGHHLLNMDMDYSRALEQQLVAGNMVMRPGWVRLNFNYFIDDETFEYLLSAVELIAEHGWRLLPFYAYDSCSGTWRYQGKSMRLVANLDDCDWLRDAHQVNPGIQRAPLNDYLEAGLSVLMAPRCDEKQYELILPEGCERLRWFALPQHVAADVGL